MYEEKEKATKYLQILKKNGKKTDKVNLAKMQTYYVAGYL